MSQDMNLIKELRTKTGAGFLDCKTALSNNNNDIEKSIEYLRKKGLAKASKKSSREANEGAIGVYSNEKLTILIKINSETDFAAKSDIFLDFVDELGNAALNYNNANLTKDNFMNVEFNNIKVSEHITNMIAKIGENLILNEIIVLTNVNNFSHYYIHNSYRNNIGKIVSLIQYETKINDEKIKELSKNVCMHIAAMKPESLSIDDLDKDFIDKEKKIQKELILNSGKPENIVEKILDGKMNKFYSDVTLLNQSYIIDPDKKVSEILAQYKSKYEFEIKKFKLISLS